MQSVVEAKQKPWLLELLIQGAGGAGGAETAEAQSTLMTLVKGLTTGERRGLLAPALIVTYA